MSEFLPYFAGIITLIFGIGFGLTTLRSNKNSTKASELKKDIS
jgi:hypothetical protein